MNFDQPEKSLALKASAVIAIVFGLMTLFSGGSVLFGGEPARAAAGNYVPFVVWFNFIAGAFYVAAGAGLWLRQRWAVVLAVFILVATLITFAFFGWHILSGGSYEFRTMAAMGLRSFIWLVIASIGYRKLAVLNNR